MQRRQCRTRLIPLVLLAVVGLAPAGVQLVESDGSPYFWDLSASRPNVVGGEVTYYVDPRGSRNPVSGTKSAVDAQRDGIQEWTSAHTSIRFREDTSRTANGPSAFDAVNWVGFVDDAEALGSMTFAATLPTRANGRLIDSDVVFNDRDFIWSTRTPGVIGSPDIQSLMTHEWGHAIGAEHVPLRQSTMYFSSTAGSTALRSLSADDRALLESIYPDGSFASETGSIAGVVRRATGTDHRSIHVVAISLASGEAASSTLTGPQGAYIIRGLPRGTYRVVATPTLPLGVSMNAFWRDVDNTFLPTALTTDGANPGPVLEVEVNVGTPTTVPTMTVAAATNPLESNDTAATATPIDVDSAVVARFESRNDRDYYSFSGTAGQLVSIQLMSWNLGSAADPTLELQRGDGFPVVPEIRDNRDTTQFGFALEGPDLDAQIVAFELPADDTYVIRARATRVGRTSENFYLLLVTEASNAPSAALSEVTALPARVDADGVSTSAVTIRPRRETGDEIGPGAEVSAALHGHGTVGPVRDQGDGTYAFEVTAPTTPSTATLDVEISNDEGTAMLADAVTFTWLGPADAERSLLTASPRRIDADGSAVSIVSLEPRDIRDESLGAGRSVTFSSVGAGATAPTMDAGNGRYLVEVTAPTAGGSLELEPTVDGELLGRSIRVAFGFDLDDVLADSDQDLTSYELVEDLSRGARRKLESARNTHAKAVAARLGGNDPASFRKAVSSTRRLVVLTEATRKKAKGSLPALPTERDLARAVRRIAELGIARAIIVTGKDQGRVDKASELLLQGDDKFAEGNTKSASAKWLKAYKRIHKLQPELATVD